MARTPKPIKRIRQALEAPVICLALRVLPGLSRGSILRLARLFGCVGYYLSSQTRRLGLANLDLAFGETKTRSEKKAILRRSLQNFSLVMLDLLWFSRDPLTRVERWFQPSSRMQEALAVQKPRVGVTGHFGNWELTGRYWALRAGSVMSVAMPLKNPSVDTLLQRAREKNGQEVIERKGALRKLVRRLKEGGTVGLLLDQNTSPKEGGVFADFFGLPVAVSPAAGVLAAMSGAEIFMCYSLPQADGSYRADLPHIITSEEIAGMDREGLAQKLTERITGFYEEEIRKNPECWLWSYKRWRFIPDGISSEPFPYYSYSVQMIGIASEKETEPRAKPSSNSELNNPES